MRRGGTQTDRCLPTASQQRQVCRDTRPRPSFHDRVFRFSFLLFCAAGKSFQTEKPSHVRDQRDKGTKERQAFFFQALLGVLLCLFRTHETGAAFYMCGRLPAVCVHACENRDRVLQACMPGPLPFTSENERGAGDREV